jgi:hypothetical protein
VGDDGVDLAGRQLGQAVRRLEVHQRQVEVVATG